MSFGSHYDVVIIGSGAGGGTVADVVSREAPGADVLVLEGGPLWRHDQFNERERDMGRLFFSRGAKPSTNLTVNLAAASAVGGSAVVYTGVSFRPPDRVVAHWRDRFGRLRDRHARRHRGRPQRARAAPRLGQRQQPPL